MTLGPEYMHHWIHSTAEGIVMDRAKSPEVQDHSGDDDTQRREILKTSGQSTSRTENVTTDKKVREMEPSDSEPEGKGSKVEQVSIELNSKDVGTALTQNLRAENIPILDTQAALRRVLDNPMEMRSLQEDQTKAQEFSTLGVSAYEQFKRTGGIENIDRAIEYWGVAVTLLRGSRAECWSLLSNLGCAYESRFGHLGHISDLGNAIEFGEEAVSLTPDGHPLKPGYLSNLGVSYETRFRRLGELPALNKAIKFKAQAVSLTPDGHPHKPGYLNNLGNSCETRFGRLGELLDLEKAIEYKARASSLTSDGHSHKPGYLNNLGVSYETRFWRLGELPDLNKAIKFKAQAVSLTPDGHPHKPGYLNNLGVSYKTRFGRLGELPDLNKAIDYKAQAVSLTHDSHPDKPGYLNNLGGSYETRFGRLGKLPDLEKAIEHIAQAVSLTPDAHSDKPGYLNGLGNSYETRFRRLGELPDLNKAMEYIAQAVLLTPDGHLEKPGYLTNLGVSYETRFRRLGELPDLDKAVEHIAQAVSLTPDGHSHKPAILNNLGNSYDTRFGRLGELPDLNKAIEYKAQAASLAPDDHPHKPGYLNNLGVSCKTRFGLLGELPDLDKAIESKAQAVSLTPDDHPLKPERLNNLGVSYKTRFGRLGELPDLNKAIEHIVQAVSLTPDDHPDKSVYLNNLGNSYETRFGHLSEFSDLESAGSSFKKASLSPTGPPSVRFNACQKWAKLCLHHAMPSPLPAYQRAMSLVPQLVWIGTTIGRRYELVAEVSSFATEGASHAIAVGAYDLALEWLEVGRSIVWSQIAQLRTPFEHLSRYDSKLAEDLASVGSQLEHAGFRSSLSPPPETSEPDLGQEARTHVQLALRWDSLVEEVRSRPGFEDFLRSPTAVGLLRAAKAQPIAIINLHGSRCDALIIQPNNETISHVALPHFSSKEAISARNHVFFQVRDRTTRPRPKPPGPLQSTLESVWLSVIKPVLEFLGYTRKLPVDQLPHLMWCTSGPLSFLPFHAAQSCDESQPGTFDLVISSYTPTLSALLSGQSVDPSTTCGIVAVGQENTPGLSPLPCTTKELAVVHKHTRSEYYLQLEGDEATVANVLEAMDQFSWVHVACHGSQDADDSTKSAFHLHDGSLTLATIAKRSFTNKGLAFLSACQTATGDNNMPDEAVHLAAGMLMAGYPSVIGTMWSIADEDGPEVANLVYAELLKDGKMDHTKAARALHKAVAGLRTKVGKKALDRWAPFVHLGS